MVVVVVAVVVVVVYSSRIDYCWFVELGDADSLATYTCLARTAQLV